MEEIVWSGEKAIRLRNHAYEALILTGIGANCISFRHVPSGAEFLRTPPDAGTLRAEPNVYGLPLLFPPNRIGDGSYVFQGRQYTFLINEPERHNHIHGLLSQMPFHITGEGRFEYRATPESPYPGFPHAFTVIREYKLTDDGFSHRVVFRNDSDAGFALGTGIHAAFHLPFYPGDDPLAYRLKIPAEREWVLDDRRKLPTGVIRDKTPLLYALKKGELIPDSQPLSVLIQCGPGPLILGGPSGSLRCERDGYGFVMLWNGGGGKGFVCPEPQTWATNAPNLQLPWPETRMRCLMPGEEASFTLRLHWESD